MAAVDIPDYSDCYPDELKDVYDVYNKLKYTGKNVQPALDLLNKLARKGSIDALYLLGKHYYYNGDDDAKEYAIDALTEALYGGRIESAYILRDHYRLIDNDLYEYYYKMIAHSKMPSHSMNYTYHHALRRLDGDDKYYAIEECADNGDIEAMIWIVNYHNNTRPFQYSNLIKWKKYIAMAADKGHIESMYDFGIYCKNNFDKTYNKLFEKYMWMIVNTESFYIVDCAYNCNNLRINYKHLAAETLYTYYKNDKNDNESCVKIANIMINHGCIEHIQSICILINHYAANTPNIDELHKYFKMFISAMQANKSNYTYCMIGRPCYYYTLYMRDVIENYKQDSATLFYISETAPKCNNKDCWVCENDG